MQPTNIRALASGYRQAQILLSANKLRIFDVLDRGPSTAEKVSEELGLNTDGCSRLLNALAALGVLKKAGSAFRNGPEAAEFLVSGKPRYLGHNLDHSLHLYEEWRALEERVRHGHQQGSKMNERTAEEQDVFIRAMHGNARFRAEALAAAVDLSGRQHLLDVGGGSGEYGAAFMRRFPDLKATLFDRSEALAVARRILEEEGWSDRVEFCAGDAFEDDWGRGYDCVLFSNFLHIFSPAQNVGLLVKARSVLPAGGLVIIHEFYLDDDRTKPLDSTLFSLNMLINSDGGDAYTGAEYGAFMEQAGFRLSRTEPVTDSHVVYVGEALP